MTQHCSRAWLLVLVVAVVAAGCIGAPPENDDPPIRATAGAATLGEETRTTAGYQVARETSGWLNVTVFAEIQGDVTLQTERQVNATVSVAEYRRRSSGEPAVFALYTAPGIQPFERANLTKNPAESVSKRTLVEAAQSAYTDVGELKKQDTRSVTLLGNETTLTTYATTATHSGASVEVRVRLATVRHRDDFVTVLLVAPAGADQPVGRLLDGVSYKNGTLT